MFSYLTLGSIGHCRYYFAAHKIEDRVAFDRTGAVTAVFLHH